MSDIYAFLDQHNINYQRFDHPAVFTCEDADKLDLNMPGVSIKNLFLRDKNAKRHFLVVISTTKKADLKALSQTIDISKLSFGSPESLKQHLGVEPGSVTLLGLINDQNKEIEVFIDQELQDQALQCHPLINTASLVIQPKDIKKFLEITGHAAKFIEIPERA